MYRKTVVCVAIISLFFSQTPLSFAQQEQAGEEQKQEQLPQTQATQPQGELQTDAEEPAKDAEEVSTPGNVTIDFKDADIHNVLRILSYKSGVNIVAGKDVEGTVTLRLVDVPWEKALDVVLKTYGFAFERDGNIIRVATVENLGQEPLKTEVFSVSYGKAEEISESIKEIISPRGSVRADKRSNTIIVTDIPTNIYKVQQVIDKLDAPTPQVFIDTKVIETTIDDNEKLGIDWTVQVTAKGSKVPTTAPFNVDFARTQFLKKMVPLGESGSDFQNLNSASFPKVSDAFTGTGAQWAFGTLDFSSFQAILYALNTRSDTKVISNPRTVTLNNQEAMIHIGDSIYVPIWQESTTTGSPVFQGINKTELDTGIKLKVTPHVNAKDEIVVDLEPEVSTLGTATAMLTDSSGRTINYFPVSVRTAKTQVMIKDGETIAIGGLMKEEKSKTRNKVPFLGDIPLLGYFFKYTADTTDTKDLLIFVTVRLIKSDDDTKGLYSEITERMDKFDNEPTALGHQYQPDTPLVSKKKKEMRLLVE